MYIDRQTDLIVLHSVIIKVSDNKGYMLRKSLVPLDGGVLILCESPVCVWLLQLQGRRKSRHKNDFIKRTKSPYQGTE